MSSTRLSITQRHGLSGTSPAKELEHLSHQKRPKELGLFNVTQKKLKESSSMFFNLMGGIKDDKVRCFSVMSSNSIRGNKQNLKSKKLSDYIKRRVFFSYCEGS